MAGLLLRPLSAIFRSKPKGPSRERAQEVREVAGEAIPVGRSGPPHSAGAPQIPCSWHGRIPEMTAAVKRDLSTRNCQFNNSHAFRVALTDG